MDRQTAGREDPRYAQIVQGIDAIGQWSADERKNLADHLYAQVARDSSIREVHQVTLSGAGDSTKVFAVYQPNGDQPPMFHANVDTALRTAAVPPPAPAVDKDGYFTDPAITRKPIPALEKGDLPQINAIVLHRTESATAQSALNSFKTGTGAHFLIDKDGTIYQTASLNEKTYHVGKIKSRCMEEGTCTPEESKTIKDMGWNPGKLHNHEAAKAYPDRFPMNGDSVGIEVVGSYNAKTKTWDAPTPEQKAAIAKLVGMLQSEYGLQNNDVYQHDKISYKTPGEGAGLWDPKTQEIAPEQQQGAPKR